MVTHIRTVSLSLFGIVSQTLTPLAVALAVHHFRLQKEREEERRVFALLILEIKKRLHPSQQKRDKYG